MTRTALVLLALVPGSLTQSNLWAQDKPRPAEHLLRYSFRAGDEGRFQVREDRHSGGEENKREGFVVVIRDMHWKVVSTDGTWSVMELRLDRLRIKESGQDGVAFDSKTDDHDEMPKAWAYLEIAKPLRYRVDSRGSLDVPQLKDEKRKDQVLFDLRSMVRQLPELPVAVGSKWDTDAETRIWGRRHSKVSVGNELVGVKKGKVTLAYEVKLPKRTDGVRVETKESGGEVVFDLGRFVPDRVDQTMQTVLKGRWIRTTYMEWRFRIGPPGSLEKDVPVVGGK